MQVAQLPKKPTAQVAVLSVQSGLTLLAALGLVASGIRHINKLAQPTQGHRILVAAFLFGLVGAATLTSVVGIAKSKKWGRIVGVVAESAFAVLGIASLSKSPVGGAVVIGIAGLSLFLLSRIGSVWDSPGSDRSHRWDFQNAEPARIAQPSQGDVTSLSSMPTSATPPEPKSDRSSVILAVVTVAILLGALLIRSRIIFGLVVLAAIFIPIMNNVTGT